MASKKETNNSIPERSIDYLNSFKNNFSSEQIISLLSSLKDINVLVIGDCILDEYVFCDVMERAKKEPILVFKHVIAELYAGGVFAIANHVANFAGEVSLITSVGNDDKTLSFLKNKLNPKIQNNFFSDNNNTTLTKRRYVYRYRNTKVFETYSHSDYDLNRLQEQEIINHINNNLNKFDVILVADFGHGFITDNIRNCILKTNKFLAVNAQTNSGNLGYNYITKYKNLDYVAMTEEELRLPLQDPKSTVSELVKKLSDIINCKKICITQGSKGILYYENGIHELPILSKKVVDTLGAGDAILSVTSLLAYKGVKPEIIPFIGNCVGALAVQVIGNKQPVSPIDLNKFISDVLG